MISYPLLAATAFTAAFQGYGTPRPAPPAPRPQAPAKQVAPAPVPQLAIPTSPPGRALKDLPNVTVRHYNVAGKNLKGAIKSITEQRPKDSSGQPVTASTNWTIKTEFNKRTDGKGACKITGAQATLAATAELPRLVDERSFNKRDLNAWQAYVATLETTAAAKLWFVHDHTGDVQKAILASTCDAAQSAGTAATEQLRKRSNELQLTTATAVAPAPVK